MSESSWSSMPDYSGSDYPDAAYDPSANWQSATQKPSLLDALLPGPALPMLALLVLLLPLSLLTAKSLFLPFFEWIRSIVLPVNVGITYTHFSLVLLIKMLLFGAFAFTGVMLMVLKLVCIYHQTWAKVFDRPNGFHPPYHPHPRDSMIALFNWNLYRLYRIIGPPIGYAAMLLGVMIIGFWFFDLLDGFFPMFIQFTLGFFASGLLTVLMIYTFFRGLWLGFSTLTADVVATTEPELSTQTVFERSNQLAYLSPWSLVMTLAYLVFLVYVGVSVCWFLDQFEVHALLQFSPALLQVYGTTALIIALFIALNFLKFTTYHDALNRFYDGYQHLCQ